MFNLEPVLFGNVWSVNRFDTHEHNALVQNLVVFQVMFQRSRGDALVRNHENRGAGNAVRRCGLDSRQKVFDGDG